MGVRRARLVVVALGALGGGALAFACTIADSLRVPGALAPDSSGGAADGAFDAGVDADPCRHAAFPGPPTQTVGIAGGNVYTLVTDSLDFGRVDGGIVAVGYNLDRECTCSGSPPDPESCVARSAQHCDKLGGGVDNAAADLVNGPVSTNGFDLQALMQRGLMSGRSALLFKLEDYNGEANDTTVTLSFYVSDGPAAANGLGAGFTSPTFALSDLWTVDQSSLVGGTDPTRYLATARTGAYVTDGVLVATGLSAGVRLDTYWVMDLRNFMVTGKLVKDPASGLFHLENGVLAGRWSTLDALRDLGAVLDPDSDGGRLCQNALRFGEVKSILCPAADISATGPDNANLTCDALSVGLHFTAVPATFGAVVPADTSPSPCASATVDFTCPN